MWSIALRLAGQELNGYLSPHSIQPFEIGIVILQSVSERQLNKIDWSGKNADFSTLIGCHGNIP